MLKCLSCVIVSRWRSLFYLRILNFWQFREEKPFFWFLLIYNWLLLFTLLMLWLLNNFLLKSFEFTIKNRLKFLFLWTKTLLFRGLNIVLCWSWSCFIDIFSLSILRANLRFNIFFNFACMYLFYRFFCALLLLYLFWFIKFFYD